MEPTSAHVTPSEEMVDLFDSWDTTKTKSKLKSFNRAKSWFCRLLKCPFPGLPKGHHMRREDTDKAFQLVLEAYSSGVSFEDFIKSSLQGTIVVKSENVSKIASSGDEGSEDIFSDAPESIIEETIEAAVTTVPTIIITAAEEETEVVFVTGEAAAEVPKRPPVCKLLWSGEVCTVQGCEKSHPLLCEDPRCLELDNDLPHWKAIGCKKWHGRTKSSRPKPRKAKKYPRRVPSQKSRAFHGSRPQTMGRAWPQTWSQPPAQAWLQTVDQPKPHTPLEIDLWNQVHRMGNSQAAQTPLSWVGNNQWGNGRMPYNMAVKGPNSVMPNQLERAYTALVLNRGLA